jgi:hypothetical protein
MNRAADPCVYCASNCDVEKDILITNESVYELTSHDGQRRVELEQDYMRTGTSLCNVEGEHCHANGLSRITT